MLEPDPMNSLSRTNVLLGLLGLTLVSSSSFAQGPMGHESSGGRPVPMAFGVQFTSSGSGIDGSSYKAVLQYIGQSLSEGTLSKILNKKWGREGETSICLEFNGPNTSGNALIAVQKIIRDTRNPSKPKPTTTGLLKCDDATFGPFSGDDRSLEVYGDNQTNSTGATGMSGCISMSVQAALDAYAKNHALFPVPTMEVAQSTGSPSNGIDIMVSIDKKVTYYVIASPNGSGGCTDARVGYSQ